MAGRLDAQARADQIRAFQEELAQLESELGAVLDAGQRAKISAHHDALLADFARTFDVSTTESDRQLALGLRFASFLGALALCIAVVLFVERFWGGLTTGVQVEPPRPRHRAGPRAHRVRRPPGEDPLLRRTRRAGGLRGLRHRRLHAGPDLQPGPLAAGVPHLGGLRRRIGLRLRTPAPAPRHDHHRHHLAGRHPRLARWTLLDRPVHPGRTAAPPRRHRRGARPPAARHQAGRLLPDLPGHRLAPALLDRALARGQR